jgi:hypothetical protein
VEIIKDLLQRDLSKKIEGIVKVDQSDENSVFTELTEYVVTERIKEQYHRILNAIAEAPSFPTEGVGIWISGFFGSGKSSFAKILGYILSNREVLGHRASELFKKQVNDQKISDLLNLINQRTPMEAILFDVSVNRAAKRHTERIAEIMYTVLLRELGYAEDYDIAELEIELEAEGKLDDFIELCRREYGEWGMVRKGAQRFSRASALLHYLDPSTYATKDSWAHSLRDKVADITVGKLVDRAFTLMERRRPGRALVIIIDEVGQYVARSADKIEDLRAVVEQFGKVGKNMVQKRRFKSPFWIAVTSQERLDEVVAAIDDKRVELAKLQDRFSHRVDLAPADIREVATRRVLAKKEEARPLLSELFTQYEGQINTFANLERTSRESRVGVEDFYRFYPYLPHYVDLSIDIISGIRRQSGALRQLGGSNRTMINQAYEMLVGHRTKMAEEKVGRLVTLDLVFNLLEGNLPMEKQKDITDIEDRFSDEPWCGRVAKVICLLEFVRDLPRTEKNIASLLYDAVGADYSLDMVLGALQRLVDHQFVKETEEGYKLQTSQEKNWETERQSLHPKPRDRNEILRQAASEVFSDPRLKTYKYKDLRTFQVGVTFGNKKIGADGQIPLEITIVESSEDFNSICDEIRRRSRTELNNVYWVAALGDEVDTLQVEIFRSQEMVKQYERLRSQNKINREMAGCLSDEKIKVGQLEGKIKVKLLEMLKDGRGFFRGISKDGADLGNNFIEIIRNLLNWVVPELYSKLEVGARPINGKEPEEVLKAVNLGNLSEVFYDGQKGLSLVVRQDGKYVLNAEAEIAREIMGYLRNQHAYGEKVTGKMLENYFQGFGYGWERDVLRLVLAVLLRAGVIEVTHQGKRYRDYQDALAKIPFTNNVAFRNASFAPRESVGLELLTRAAKYYEELTGAEVDVEEIPIAEAFKSYCQSEMQTVIPLEAEARANGVAVLDLLRDYHSSLEEASNSSSDDCVRILAGQGTSFKDWKEKLQKIKEILQPTNLELLKWARKALTQMWPIFKERKADDELAGYVAELEETIKADDFYNYLPEIRRLTEKITRAYHLIYEEIHDKRSETYRAALDELKGMPEWMEVLEEAKEPLVRHLKKYICPESLLDESSLYCGNCQASIDLMEADLDAADGRLRNALNRLMDLTAPQERMERIRLADYFQGTIETEDQIRDVLEKLEEQLIQMIRDGVRIIIE